MQWILWTREMCLHNRTQDGRRHYRANNRARGVRRMPRVRMFVHGGVKQLEIFWWRCAYGTHPFPSRTRRLRRKRPMVLCWRRHGRAGGCQIQWGCSSVGRAPALQAGGQGFESLHLHCVYSTHLRCEPRKHSFLGHGITCQCI